LKNPTNSPIKQLSISIRLMKTNQQVNPGTNLTPKNETPEDTERNFFYHLPPGAKFSDIYIDAQVVADELKICKRIVTNMRKAGKLSYTTLDDGKIYYLRQEIAAMLKANMVIGKNSLLKHFRFNFWVATSASLFSLVAV
jgi:hypothetical protein